MYQNLFQIILNKGQWANWPKDTKVCPQGWHVVHLKDHYLLTISLYGNVKIQPTEN